MRKALVLVDFINEMASERGKLASKGYYDYAQSHETAEALAAWRERLDIAATIHVGLEFKPDYSDAPTNSVLLGKVAEFAVAKAGEPGSEFVEWAAPREDDVVLHKNRISPFFGTALEETLKELQIDTIVLGGIATDLAISSAARDAHDRNFVVQVGEDICVAANQQDHDNAIVNMTKFAQIVKVNQSS